MASHCLLFSDRICIQPGSSTQPHQAPSLLLNYYHYCLEPLSKHGALRNTLDSITKKIMSIVSLLLPLLSLSLVWVFATPWTVARQVPLSMGFTRQVYWSGLPFSFFRGIFPTRGLNLCLLCSAGIFLTAEPLKKPLVLLPSAFILCQSVEDRHAATVSRYPPGFEGWDHRTEGPQDPQAMCPAGSFIKQYSSRLQTLGLAHYRCFHH